MRPRLRRSPDFGLVATTLTFAHKLSYGRPTGTGGTRTGIGSRAYIWFKIVNPATGAASRREFALVDSGCDECLLDDGLLTGLGLVTVSSTVGIAGGGTATVQIAHTADIEVEGVLISGRPLTFGNASTSLVGRDIYLRAFELAFTGSDWYHG
jgi:hypothetical protein